MIKQLFCFVVLSLFTVNLLFCNLLEQNLSLFDMDNVNGYLQPFANSFGAGMNSGFYNSAKVLRPFQPSLRISAAVIVVPDRDLTFIATAPNLFMDEEGTKMYHDTETATIFGNKGGRWEKVNWPGGGPFPGPDLPTLPGGIDFNIVPVPNATLAIGLPFNSECMIRYLPTINLGDEIGDINFWGFGLKHKLDQYFKFNSPFDLAVQGVYQKMTVSDILDVQTWAVNTHISKQLWWLTLYGGVGIESAKLDITYLYEEPSKPEVVSVEMIDSKPIIFSVSMKASNQYRATIGAKFRLFVLDIYADYSVSDYNSVNAGIGFGF
jgi:hypothetical protein